MLAAEGAGATARRWLARLGVALALALAVAAAPAQIADMPQSIGGFERRDFHRYEQAELGFSYRYVDDAARRWFDVYVYPVPPPLLEREHTGRVQVLTALARRDIDTAVSNGIYLSQTDLGVEGYEIDGLVLFKSRHGIRTAQGELYSVLYLTETGGQAVKLRVSVPSTALNAVTEDFEEAAVAVVFHVVEALQAR